MRHTWNVGASPWRTSGTDTIPPAPVVVTFTMCTCPVPDIDVDSIHLDHIPSIEASSTLTVPLTNIRPYSSELATLPVTTPRATVLKPTIDNALPREMFINKVRSTFSRQSLLTLTLYTSMVVSCMNRVLLENVMEAEESVTSTYNCQSTPTLTLCAPIVVSKMDRALLAERVVKGVDSGDNTQSPTTLTLDTSMVVPCMDRVLLVERVMREEEKDAYSAYNRQLLPTLTLCASTVVSCMDRVLLVERVMGRYVSRRYNCQLPPTLTLCALIVVP